jgi:putative adenylate-forming enzyme
MDVTLLMRVLWMRRVLRRHERWNANQIEARQTVQLHTLRTHAYTHSRFYRKFHSGSETKPLHELPVLKKSELMSNFDDLVTDRDVHLADVHAHLEQLQGDGLFRGKYRVTRTAGSTGKPGVFLSDPIEWANIIASYSRAQEWAGIFAGITQRTRLAVVSSLVPSHQSARVGASVNSPFIPVRRFDSTQPLRTIIDGLNAWQPHNLIAYASMARILAEEQSAGRLHISPHAVMSASEVLTDESREKIQRAWSCQSFNVYAATETAGIASECALHRLHLFEDLVITEVVDDNNRRVPVGEFGAKLLVTVLFSRTQPLIRYEMSDRVMRSSDSCDCGLGFALLRAIEGRSEDILELPARSGGSVRIHPNVFHTILEPLPVQAWQILDEPDAIRVLLARPESPIDTLRLSSEIERTLEQQGALPRPIRIELVEEVTKTALGKAPLVRARRTLTLPQGEIDR